jgi:hypothetical protein
MDKRIKRAMCRHCTCIPNVFSGQSSYSDYEFVARHYALQLMYIKSTVRLVYNWGKLEVQSAIKNIFVVSGVT